MPATLERLILDPTEGISSRTAFAITDWIDQEGTDYGEAAIEAFMADLDRGSIPVDYTVPNREITMPLKGITRGGTTWVTALASFQSKVALFQKEGGVLKRLTNSGGTVYADIVDASLTATSVSGYESTQELDLDASLSLTVLPDWYGPEQTLADHTETTAAELVFTETSIDGDYPARVRMVVDNDQATDQKGLIWGYRSRHYSSASTASTKYEAEALNPIGTAVATTGASNGTAVRVSPLFPTWTSALGTNIAGTQWMTHTGTNRVFARCYVQGTVQSQIRLSYDTADLVNAVVNDPYTLPSPGAGTTVGSAYFIADLGEVRLDAAPVGTHRWQGQVDAQTYNTVAGTADFRIDRVWVVNQDEGAGVLTAPQVEPPSASTLTAFDTFAGTALLASSSAPLGGNWDPGAAGASTAEDGDTDDFTEGGSYALRAPGADSSITNGRYVTLDGSSTLSTVTVQADVGMSALTAAGESRIGVMARYVDTDNWCMAVLGNVVTNPASPGPSYLALLKRVAGVVTQLGGYWISGSPYNLTSTIKLVVDSAGNASVYWTPATVNPAGSLGAARIVKLADSDLDSGAIDDGKIGVYSASTSSAAIFQVVQNFKAYSPAFTTQSSDAVMFASRSAQLTTTGHYRQDTGGTAYGPVSQVVGDLPRLPVAGLEGRTTEVFLKPTRSDLNGAAQLPDAAIDDISCRITYQPSWLHVPGT